VLRKAQKRGRQVTRHFNIRKKDPKIIIHREKKNPIRGVVRQGKHTAILTQRVKNKGRKKVVFCIKTKGKSRSRKNYHVRKKNNLGGAETIGKGWFQS